jgi:hypothetical protein
LSELTIPARERMYGAIKPLSTFKLPEPPKDGPAVLIYDIETAPATVFVWSQWQTNVIATERDWYLLSFAFKWLGQAKTFFVSIVQDPAFTPDTTNDLFVAERLAALYERADVVVAHNGDRFDQRKANARFLFHGIDPPAPYQQVDTLKEARRNFANYSNSLGELGRLHELGDKMPHTGFELWRECMRGTDKFWKVMEKYNRQDVTVLENLYLRLLPWIGIPGKQAHPNRGHWDPVKGFRCPKCGSEDVVKNGTHRTAFSEFQTFRCKNCRGYSRARLRTPQIDKKVELV